VDGGADEGFVAAWGGEYVLLPKSENRKRDLVRILFINEFTMKLKAAFNFINFNSTKNIALLLYTTLPPLLLNSLFCNI
jgi:hypothetical protein